MSSLGQRDEHDVTDDAKEPHNRSPEEEPCGAPGYK